VQGRHGDVGVDALCEDGLLVLAAIVDVEKFASAEGECHGLVVLLQLVVDFGEDEGGKLAMGEGFIFVECFSVDRQILVRFHGNV
jgi:hypothetical protein